MKKILLGIMLLGASMMNTGCFSPNSIDAGEEAVIIKQPWFFGHGGVEKEPVKTGLVWTAFSTSVARYNIKPEKYTEPIVDLTTTDNVAVDFDVYLTLSVIERKSPLLHEKSGVKWYTNKVKDKFREIVRNEARTRSSIELRTNPEIITTVSDKIKKKIVEYIKEIALPVKVNKVVIGKVIPPDEVLKEAERTAAQRQRNKTEQERAKTELSRAEAEKNKALADKQYAMQFKMSTDQFLKNKELEVISELGKTGKVQVIMGGVTPMMTVK